MTNTFYNADEVKEYIIEKLNSFKEEDDITLTEENIYEFLYYYTVNEYCIHNYDFTQLTSKCIFGCIEYVKNEYKESRGNNIDIDDLDTEDKLIYQMLYWVGEEWRVNLEEYEDSDGFDFK